MNALICLASNRDSQMKLRQEIKQVLSKDPDNLDDVEESIQNNDHDVIVTMTHLQRMPYLDMVLHESLRLLATVPINMRSVSTDFPLKILQPQRTTMLKDSSNIKKPEHQNKYVVVPKDTIIAVDTFNLQRNVEFWGPSALTFLPEHFSKERELENDEEKSTRRHSYAFVPFSKGIRTCIGKKQKNN